MMERIGETSPRVKARITGAFYLQAILTWQTFLYQPLGYHVFPYIAALGLLGAASLTLWLRMFGLNEQRWRSRPVQRGIGDSRVPCTLDSMLRVRKRLWAQL
jgi:hypothetical protein